MSQRTFENIDKNVKELAAADVPMREILQGLSPQNAEIYRKGKRLTPKSLSNRNKKTGRGTNSAEAVPASKGLSLSGIQSMVKGAVHRISGATTTRAEREELLRTMLIEKDRLKDIWDLYDEKPSWDEFVATYGTSDPLLSTLRIYKWTIMGKRAPASSSAQPASSSAQPASSSAQARSSSTQARSSLSKGVPPHSSLLVAPRQRQVVRNPVRQQGVGIYGFCPLINIVATSCYMNAAMQVLYAIPELHTFFTTTTIPQIDSSDLIGDPLPNPQNLVLRNTNTPGVKMRKICITSGYTKESTLKLLKLLQIFFTNMNAIAKGQSRAAALRIDDLEYTPGGPDIYTELLTLLNIPLRQQFDAAEFLRMVLSQLWCSNLSQYLEPLFTINITSLVKCKAPPDGNGQLLSNSEVSASIELDVTQGSSIQECLTNYERDDILDKENNRLESCSLPGRNHKVGNPNAGSKQLRISVSPNAKYIFMTLKRRFYNRTTRSIEKLKNNIALNNTVTIDGKIFKLNRAICHSGSADSGHYFTYSFDAAGTPKYLFNDSSIGPAINGSKHYYDADREFINKNAISVLYERAQQAVPAPAVVPVPAVVQQQQAVPVVNTGAGTGLFLGRTNTSNSSSTEPSLHSNEGENNTFQKGGRLSSKRRTRKSKKTSTKRTTRKH